MNHAHVAPLHIGDERTDPAALGQHQETIEERAAESIVLPSVLDEESDFGALRICRDRAVRKRDDTVWLIDGFGDQAESSWGGLE